MARSPISWSSTETSPKFVFDDGDFEAVLLGVGHAGALDHQAVKVDVAAVAAVEQVQQGVFQLVRAGAADAAVSQGFDLRGAIANQLVVYGDFAQIRFR